MLGLSVVALVTLVACGDSDGTTSTTSTGTSGGGSTSSTGGAGGEGGEGGQTSTTTTTTGGGEPCKPLKNGDDPSPTPGSCDGNVATTCGQDGFLVHDACAAGLACKEYTLLEKRFNGSAETPAWVDGREVKWAACLPEGAATCPIEWQGNYYAATDPPYCDGDDRIACRTLPAPSLYDNYPQLQYGTTDGYVAVDTCDPGKKCAGSDSVGVLTCIDDDTPPCDGTEPSCAGNGIEYCGGTWESEPGYKVVEPCQLPGDICYEGTSGVFCRAPGEVPCDDATSTPACTPDNTSIVSCYDGYTTHQGCATCYDGGQQVPCRCDDTTFDSGWSWNGVNLSCGEFVGPACVPAAAADCDPSTDADTCNGEVAHRCLGHWEDIDCAALGKVCGVGEGIAGCRDASAPACSVGNSQESCDGTEIVGCCICGKIEVLFGPTLDAPCVTGFEARVDCTAFSTNYQCQPPLNGSPWAECTFLP